MSKEDFLLKALLSKTLEKRSARRMSQGFPCSHRTTPESHKPHTRSLLETDLEQPTNKPANRSTINQPSYQPTNQLTKRTTNQPTNTPVNQPINQSTNQ